MSEENVSEANVDQFYHALFDAPTLDYETWVNRYEFIRPSRYMDPESGKLHKAIVLKVTAVTGDSPEGDQDRDRRIAIAETVLRQNGSVSLLTHRCNGTKGSMGNRSSAANLEALRKAMGELPDDDKILPPFERRIMLQTIVDRKHITRVYDRANLPTTVHKLLRHISPRVEMVFR